MTLNDFRDTGPEYLLVTRHFVSFSCLGVFNVSKLTFVVGMNCGATYL